MGAMTAADMKQGVDLDLEERKKSYEWKNAWKDYKPIGVPGAKEIEDIAVECVEKAKEIEAEGKKCYEYLDKKDIRSAQDCVKKIKRLEEEVKELQKKALESKKKLDMENS